MRGAGDDRELATGPEKSILPSRGVPAGHRAPCRNRIPSAMKAGPLPGLVAKAEVPRLIECHVLVRRLRRVKIFATGECVRGNRLLT